MFFWKIQRQEKLFWRFPDLYTAHVTCLSTANFKYVFTLLYENTHIVVMCTVFFSLLLKFLARWVGISVSIPCCKCTLWSNTFEFPFWLFYLLTFVSTQNCTIKFHVFWDGHKIWQNGKRSYVHKKLGFQTPQTLFKGQ